MPEQLVPVPWIGQEELYYCGPAAAEMTLRALNAVPPSANPSWQSILWNEIKDKTQAVRPASAGPGSPSNPAYPTQKCEKCDGDWNCWSTTPTALKRVLNDYGTGVTFAVNRNDDDWQATDDLIRTIDRTIPGLALVYGWGHWLVVRGYVFDEEDADACDVAGRRINGLFIRDSNAAEALHYVTCARWHSNYLSAVPCGQYADDVVVLSASRPKTPPEPPPPPQPPLQQQRRPSRDDAGPRPMRNEPNLLPPGAAVEEAQRAAARLLRSARWKPALSGARPETPLLVQRLDHDDSYYYIVPFERRGFTTARLIVDAMTGRFAEASGVESEGEVLAPWVDPEASVRSLYGERIEFPSLRSRVIRPGTVGEHPVLVWRPCRESTSPFMPFYQRSVGSDFLYLRVDGRRFKELTAGPV